MSNQQVTLSDQDMKTYRVQGFSCSNCANTFENNVKALQGVEDANVNFGASKIYVQGTTTIEELEEALRQAVKDLRDYQIQVLLQVKSMDMI